MFFKLVAQAPWVKGEKMDFTEQDLNLVNQSAHIIDKRNQANKKNNSPLENWGR